MNMEIDLNAFINSLARGKIETFRALPQILDSGERALQANDLFHAQFDAYDALRVISDNKRAGTTMDPALEPRANALLSTVMQKCAIPELKPQDVLTYNGPIQIGNCLWICSVEDSPSIIKDELVSEIGYYLLDLSSITSYAECEGTKALREGEKVKISNLVDDRFTPDSVLPNRNITIIKKGNQFEILGLTVSGSVEKLIESGNMARIKAALKSIHARLKDTNEPDPDQLRIDVEALEAAVKKLEPGQ